MIDPFSIQLRNTGERWPERDFNFFDASSDDVETTVVGAVLSPTLLVV